MSFHSLAQDHFYFSRNYKILKVDLYKSHHFYGGVIDIGSFKMTGGVTKALGAWLIEHGQDIEVYNKVTNKWIKGKWKLKLSDHIFGDQILGKGINLLLAHGVSGEFEGRKVNVYLSLGPGFYIEDLSRDNITPSGAFKLRVRFK